MQSTLSMLRGIMVVNSVSGESRVRVVPARHSPEHILIGPLGRCVIESTHPWALARRAGRRALEMLPVSRDALDAVNRLEEMAHLHVVLGDTAEALDLIEKNLTLPSHQSPAYYRSDLRFAALRGNPRFERLTIVPGR